MSSHNIDEYNALTVVLRFALLGVVIVVVVVDFVFAWPVHSSQERETEREGGARRGAKTRSRAREKDT